MTIALSKKRLKIFAILFGPLLPLTAFTYILFPIAWLIWSPIALVVRMADMRLTPVYYAFALCLVAPLSFLLSCCLDPLKQRLSDRNLRLNSYVALAFVHQLVWALFFAAYGDRFGDGHPVPSYLEPVWGPLPPLFAVAIAGLFVSLWLFRQLPWQIVSSLHAALYLVIAIVGKELVKESRVYIDVPAIVRLQKDEAGDLTHVHFLVPDQSKGAFYASSYIKSFVALFREKDHQIVKLGYEREYRYGWPDGAPRLYAVDGWQVTQLPQGLFHPFLEVKLPDYPQYVWGLIDDERLTVRGLPEIVSSEIFRER